MCDIETRLVEELCRIESDIRIYQNCLADLGDAGAIAEGQYKNQIERLQEQAELLRKIRSKTTEHSEGEG
jgi:hypothetical protein